MKLGTLAHKRAQETDEAWQVELQKRFGRHAVDARYTKAGRGEPGSALNEAYLARTEAQEAWHAE